MTLSREPGDSEQLGLPCGRCIGCNKDRARAWVIRCRLELQQHQSAVFTTLTYNDESLPATLSKRHLQLFLKRLRKSSPNRLIRFFASGEYGETTQRPHYHAILYGCRMEDGPLIENTWGMGYTRTDPITPARIAYVAGYTAKKVGWLQKSKEIRVDPSTGEEYTWQPPFIQMSRGGRQGLGIGGHAKQWPESWRLFAINNGTKVPVPRYLHQAWEDQATAEDKEILKDEKHKRLIETGGKNTTEHRYAAEQDAIRLQAIAGSKRKY